MTTTELTKVSEVSSREGDSDNKPEGEQIHTAFAMNQHACISINETAERAPSSPSSPSQALLRGFLIDSESTLLPTLPVRPFPLSLFAIPKNRVQRQKPAPRHDRNLRSVFREKLGT